MTRVVFDTNIIVSARLQPQGPSAQLLALSDAIRFCVTGNI
jgi:predicted nucleic acid-binding protein